MNNAPYLQRRHTLLDKIGEGIAVVPTAPERYRNRDTLYPYRADSYFWYLSGFPEPEAVMVIVGGEKPRSILFCRTKNEEREIWEGFRYGPTQAAEIFGFDEAYPIDEFDERFAELLINRPHLWYSLGHDEKWDDKIIRAMNVARSQGRAGNRPPAAINDIRIPLDRMRLIKDKTELAFMKKAANIASEGFRNAMRICRPGMAEYELDAELAFTYRRQGASGHSFPPIVAGGKSACVLHYVENDKRLEDGTLVLIDSGCEFNRYASDISRTFPVNGKFTGAQRDLYEIVLAAQAAAIAAVKPQVPFMDYHEAALKVLVQGLVDLKVLTGEIDGLIEEKAYQPFYMHRTGHWLGLDVHDAGEYKDGEQWTTLKPGMTLTVEPGLYIRALPNVPERLHHIGIRIEDDVLVTETGREVYTTAPKTIAEIEEVMQRD